MRRPTLKQQAFAKEYIANKGNGTQAILKTYDTDDEKTASVMAVENLGKPSVKNLIESMQEQYVKDSYYAYEIQKSILSQSAKDEMHWELANKIANKIQDRAGFAPVSKNENKTITAKYIIKRGE